jgi:threonine/homoserine/homoserine lactone efflux protein
VTPPPYYGQQPPPAAGNDKVTLWGVLGIVFAICCWPLGIVFAVLGLLEARKVGKPPTLAYVAFGLIAVLLVVNVILAATGTLSDMLSNT